MEADPQLHARMLALLERMAADVLWQDLRDQPSERHLRGSLTRGPGPDAPWEFRFSEAVPDLRSGAVLRLPGQDQRWRVTQVNPVQLGDRQLYWAAQVCALEADGETETPEDVDGLLGALTALLERSTLGPLEAADAREALARLRDLGAKPGEPGHAVRIKPRLLLLKECLVACPQTGHSGRGLLLKLEAALRRRGLP